MTNKQYYLGWRSNPQLTNGGYYVAKGQLTKMQVKEMQKCAYGTISLTGYTTIQEYEYAITSAKEQGYSVRG